MSDLPYASEKKGLRSESVVSDYLRLWFTSRLFQVDFAQLAGYSKCQDNCGLDRSRWERKSTCEGSFYRCSICHRFIGWIKEEKRK